MDSSSQEKLLAISPTLNEAEQNSSTLDCFTMLSLLEVEVDVMVSSTFFELMEEFTVEQVALLLGRMPPPGVVGVVRGDFVEPSGDWHSNFSVSSRIDFPPPGDGRGEKPGLSPVFWLLFPLDLDPMPRSLGLSLAAGAILADEYFFSSADHLLSGEAWPCVSSVNPESLLTTLVEREYAEDRLVLDAVLGTEGGCCCCSVFLTGFSFLKTTPLLFSVGVTDADLSTGSHGDGVLPPPLEAATVVLVGVVTLLPPSASERELLRLLMTAGETSVILPAVSSQMVSLELLLDTVEAMEETDENMFVFIPLPPPPPSKAESLEVLLPIMDKESWEA